MDNGSALWKEYCSFFDKPFSEQVETSTARRDRLFRDWRRTRTAQTLSASGFSDFSEVPLTTYEDYPLLQQFGVAAEKIAREEPCGEGEELWDYYVRVARRAVAAVELDLIGEFAFAMKTSGSGGRSKWFTYDRTYWETGAQTAARVLIMSCSDQWGTTNISWGDTLLNIAAPAPYGAAAGTKTFSNFLKLSPPTLEMERIADMRKKMSLVYETIGNGTRIDFMFGPASMLSLIAKYYTAPDKLYGDLYRSMPLGVAKFFLGLKFLSARFKGQPYKKAREVLPIKGLVSTAWDGTPYIDYIRDQFGVDPFNMYAATDTHVPLMGRPHRKFDLFATLDLAYFEFLAADGQVHPIDRLQKDHLYELVVTTFGGITMRYKMGDIFRVIDIEEGGIPVFRYESRTTGMLDVRGYFNVTEAMMRDVLAAAKVPLSDTWAVCQTIEPEDRITILMERLPHINARQVAHAVFEELQRINPFFLNYVRDFRVKRAEEILAVEYLRQGAFMRYAMEKTKQGVPMGQNKPPKIIGPERSSIADRLRTV